MATWRESLTTAMAEVADSGPVIAYAPDEAAFDVEFDDGWGGSNGPSVAAWTEQYVYFPAVYDGMEWLAGVPRNPRAEGVAHVGGE